MSIILGNGKDGIVYILEKRGREYAVKQFKPHKSINKIELEAKLQQKAARYGISPIVRENGPVMRRREAEEKARLDALEEERKRYVI